METRAGCGVTTLQLAAAAGVRSVSADHLVMIKQLSINRVLSMVALIQPQHDLSSIEIDAIEERLYNHNRRAISCSDGRGLGFVIRDEAGRIIGVAAGYSWAGTSELKQMWIDEAYRGRGYARELLNAFVAEATGRGVRRIWVASYDFQAPEMYEKAGFERMAEFAEWPEGHSNVVLCKTLITR